MVCLVLGASAGHGALTSPLSDFTVMTESAAMFTGGPPLVKAALGEEVGKYKGKDRLVISARPVANGVAYRYELEQGIIALSGKAIMLFGFGGGRGF